MPKPALFSIVLALPLWAQTLKLSPVSATPGTIASITITWTPAAGQNAAALQWEIGYPSPQLGLENRDITIGIAARNAGKTLTCQGRTQNAGIYIYRCILGGGSKPIAGGPAAVLDFYVRRGARPGPVTVRLSNAVGASSDGKAITIPASQAEVTIR